MGIISWVGFGILAGVSKAGKAISLKQVAHDTDEYTATAGMRLLSALLLATLYVGTMPLKIPITDITVWGTLIGNATLLGLVGVLTARAYRMSDVSLIAPLLGLTPVAAVIPSKLLLGETFSVSGIVGIIVTSVGTVILLSDGELTRRQFRDAIHDDGFQLAVVVLLLLGVIPSFDKMGITATSPLFWATAVNLMSGLILLPIILKLGSGLPQTKRPITTFLILGVFNAGIWIGQTYAYDVANVAYVQAVKRSSILLVVLVGGSIHDETNLLFRAGGAVFIITGIILVILSTV